jgi:hypothetical protein
LKIARKYLPPVALLLVSTIGVAYAATTLFTQTFLAIPATTAVVKSNCATLTPNFSSVVTGSAGSIVFDCSGTMPFGTTPAVNVASPTVITPQFTLPVGYVSLAAVGLNIRDCTNSQGILTSGSPFNTVAGAFNYCALFQNVPSTGLATFTVTWTQ